MNYFHSRAALRIDRCGNGGRGYAKVIKCAAPHRTAHSTVWAGVAQLVEHLICNQRVGGSSPFASSSFKWSQVGCTSGFRFSYPSEAQTSALPPPNDVPATRGHRCGMQGSRLLRGWGWECAQVAEWLMAADCKSAAPRSYGGSNPPLCTRDVWFGI